MPRVVGVVLAAGSGRRMGGPKAELLVGGQRLVDRSVASLRDCAAIVVVAREGLHVAGVATIVNARPERGMRSSLDLALANVGTADAVAVTLVDLPGLGAAGVGTVIAGWTPGRIAVGSFDGRRGHPTVMSPELWRAALVVAGPDEGARSFLQTHAELVDAIEIGEDPTDLDTPDDLANWIG